MLKLVPTPIGNIADISLRAMEAFSQADIFLCEDTRVTKQLLTILKDRYSLELPNNPQFIPFHSHNEDSFLEEIEPDFFEQNVVYVSDAGMPAISDPGAKLIAYAQQNGIEYDVLPGANALLTAYAASGFLESSFCFYAFLPHKAQARESKLQTIMQSSSNIILYESPHRLRKLLEAVVKIDPKREIFLAKELTKKFQSFYHDSALNLLQSLPKEIKGEWVVIIKGVKNSASYGVISEEDIASLDIPKKQKAKLLSKVTGKSIKELYNEML